jgi:hypothetical protein
MIFLTKAAFIFKLPSPEDFKMHWTIKNAVKSGFRCLGCPQIMIHPSEGVVVVIGFLSTRALSLLRRAIYLKALPGLRQLQERVRKCKNRHLSPWERVRVFG